MSSPPKLKITFSKVFITKDHKMPNSKKVGYSATIDGIVVSHKDNVLGEYDTTSTKYLLIFRKSAVHDLGWSDETIIPQNKNSVKIEMTCFDATFEALGLIGKASAELKYPFRQGTGRVKADNGAFVLEYDVELFAKGRFGRHSTKTLFAARQNTGASTASTVSGKKRLVRMEFHPVCPTPKKGLPARPFLWPWEWSNVKNHALLAATITETSPINIVKNPAVIPVLAPEVPPRAGRAAPSVAAMDASNAANARNAASIEYTWYYPKDLNFTHDDERLEWKFTPANAPIKFVGKPNGTGVKVYATDDSVGEVVLECQLKGAKLATYRALVKKIKKVQYRVNIFKNKDSADDDDSPASGAAAIKRHMKIMNRILRQCGLELELSTSRDVGVGMTGPADKQLLAPDNTEIRKGLKFKTKILEEGIFEIDVPQGLTYNASDADQNNSAKMNACANVVNFTYIHSGHGGGTLGGMVWYEANPAANPYAESGNPSTSWKKRSGAQYVRGNQAAPCDAVNMTVGTGSQPAGESNIYGIYIVDREHASDSEFANTIAHEFGHAIGLDHRQETGKGDWPDGVAYPYEENLMHFINPATLAQDVDIVQAKVMHESPIVP